jgi:cytidine deaminase
MGINQVGDVDGKTPGIHAEHNALLKLKPLKLRKKLESINILVVRLSKNNRLQESKPCFNCIQNMSILPQQKGYKLNNIYYSDNDGNIVKTSLNKLKNDEEIHISRFYRKQLIESTIMDK